MFWNYEVISVHGSLNTANFSQVIESIDSNHHIWIFPPFSTKKSLVQQIIRFGNPEVYGCTNIYMFLIY